jgi:hypothetical protein
MRKETESNFKQEPAKKEGNKPSFDWLLFMFLAVVILLLVMVFVK